MDVEQSAASAGLGGSAGPHSSQGDTYGAAVFSPARSRRRRGAVVGWIAGLTLAIALVAVAASVHVAANATFDAAAAAFEETRTAAGAAAGSLDASVDDGADAVAAAEVIVANAADDLVDVSARTAFADATTELSASVQTGEDLLVAPVPAASERKPFWTWELLDDAPLLEAQTAKTAALAERMVTAADGLEDGGERLVEAAVPLFASVTPAAAALEAANVSARAVVLLDFRDAGAAAAGQTRVGSGAADAFSALAEAAMNLKLSAESELAEKAGPLLGTRLEIEAFARSIAGGVVLDFDWMPIVSGAGGPDGMGGMATWATVRGGFSTITLSHSVAENWPSADAQALVVHEVGHAITSKCSAMFDSANVAANEAWATAWAISMGYTATGNGVQAYGYPPQAMIDAAAGCR